MASHHPLAKLVALEMNFKADQLPYEEKLQRDRGIAVAANANTPDEYLAAWLDAQSSEEITRASEHWLFAWQVVKLILFCIGLIMGVGLARLVLQYDGAQPINIISAWIVLAGLPFILMIFWLLTLLPFKAPLISLLSQVLHRSIFQPLGLRLFKLLERPTKSADGAGFTFVPGGQLLFSMSSHLMQWFAFGLGLGSLLMTLYLLASSDLAFAWSTSFGVLETQLHTITSVIAAPFAALWSQASPSMELIQNSHYFRLEESAGRQFTARDAANQLTLWWPFVVASISFYAVLPRLITLFISNQRLTKTIQNDIQSLPDYAGLIARMSAPLVSTAHSTHSTATHLNEPAPAAEPMVFSLSAPLINWGQIDIDEETLKKALKRIGLTAQHHFEGGGRNSTREDAAIIKQLDEDKAQDALVLIKAWEPPVLEFIDWLRQLRTSLDGSIIVLLIDTDNKQPSPSDTELWRTELQQLADPALYVETLKL